MQNQVIPWSQKLTRGASQETKLKVCMHKRLRLRSSDLSLSKSLVENILLYVHVYTNYRDKVHICCIRNITFEEHDYPPIWPSAFLKEKEWSTHPRCMNWKVLLFNEKHTVIPCLRTRTYCSTSATTYSMKRWEHFFFASGYNLMHVDQKLWLFHTHLHQ